MSEVTWVLENRLARSHRPGRFDPPGPMSPLVNTWCDSLEKAGIRSILCLLSPEQLDLYVDVPGGLLAYYKSRGFDLAHVPVVDHKSPPLDDSELDGVWEAFRDLKSPVLVHCSAGVDRTGAAVERILAELDVPRA